LDFGAVLFYENEILDGCPLIPHIADAVSSTAAVGFPYVFNFLGCFGHRWHDSNVNVIWTDDREVLVGAILTRYRRSMHTQANVSCTVLWNLPRGNSRLRQ
jgi:hypothetical protein